MSIRNICCTAIVGTIAVMTAALSLRGDEAPGPSQKPSPAAGAEAAVKAVRLLTLPDYTEGVVFDHEGRGYVSHATTITRFTLDGKHETWAETGGPNGHKILADGTHLVCDRSHKAVLHLSADGKMLEPAAKAFDDKPLAGPNDLTLDAPNGGFYFTDPEGSTLEQRTGAVYYVDRERRVHQVVHGMAYPNGVALTPDGKRLYLGESLTNRVHVYEVLGPGKLGDRRTFTDLPEGGLPDGMCLDAAGNLYVAHFGKRRVQVLDRSGKLIASHKSGNLTSSNVAFGGPDMNQLFVSGALGELGKSEGAVFRLDLGAKGLKILPEKAEK